MAAVATARATNAASPRPPQRAATTPPIVLAIVSILMFFMALTATFLVRKIGTDWVPVHLPFVVWVNTVILLASSGTMELARRKQPPPTTSAVSADSGEVTTVLGDSVPDRTARRLAPTRGARLLRQTNPASSFFYIFTAAHGLHLMGGVGALFYVLFREFEKTSRYAIGRRRSHLLLLALHGWPVAFPARAFVSREVKQRSKEVASIREEDARKSRN